MVEASECNSLSKKACCTFFSEYAGQKRDINNEEKIHKSGIVIFQGTPEGAGVRNTLKENIHEEGTTGIEREKDERDERWKRGEAANSVARQAGVEEGIWTELWSRSLPVRLTQQPPCHQPNPPNHPSTTGAETSKDWRGGLCEESNGRVRKGEGRKGNKGEKWKERMDGFDR